MTAPRWLNNDEMQLWRSFIECSSGIFQKVEADLKQDAELDFDDYEVLVHLSENHETRLRMSDLSDRLLHSQSRLTQRINRLSKRGLVRREKCDQDARVTYAIITNKGRSTIEAAAPNHVASVRRHLIDQLDAAEVKALGTTLERIATTLRVQ